MSVGDQESGGTAWDDSLKNVPLYVCVGGVLLRFWSQALFVINCKVKSSEKDKCEGFSIRTL